MKIDSVFSNAVKWLGSTELFARPYKQVPGKWALYEYYTEVDDELKHFEEKQLKKENLYWEIEFSSDEQLYQNGNIQLSIPKETNNLTWNRKGLYLNFVNSENQNKITRFRFAVDKGILRLLKKDSSGKILFFGFFKRLGS